MIGLEEAQFSSRLAYFTIVQRTSTSFIRFLLLMFATETRLLFFLYVNTLVLLVQTLC